LSGCQAIPNQILVGAKDFEIMGKMEPKTSQMEARNLPNRGQRAPRGSQDTPKTEKEDSPNIKHPSVR